MEDRIPWIVTVPLQCMLQERWALIVGKKCIVEMCFPDEWTWHITYAYYLSYSCNFR